MQNTAGNSQISGLKQRIEELEAENLKLRRELISARRAHLEDVEKDIALFGQLAFLGDETSPPAVEIEDRETAEKWKRAYESLAGSKLGRLQRFYWGLRSKNK